MRFKKLIAYLYAYMMLVNTSDKGNYIDKFLTEENNKTNYGLYRTKTGI